MGKEFHPYAATLEKLLGGDVVVDHVGLSGVHLCVCVHVCMQVHTHNPHHTTTLGMDHFKDARGIGQPKMRGRM